MTDSVARQPILNAKQANLLIIVAFLGGIVVGFAIGVQLL
jgi:hypothetical protein